VIKNRGVKLAPNGNFNEGHQTDSNKETKSSTLKRKKNIQMVKYFEFLLKYCSYLNMNVVKTS
jgi:hypothetical protein